MPSNVTRSEAVKLFNGGVDAGIAPVVGQTVAAEHNAAIAANLTGLVSHNGWLFAESVRSATEALVAQDGYVAKDGAISDLGFSGSYYTSTPAGLYMQVIGTRVRLEISNVVGTFTIGELLTQAGSGATGRYVRTVGSEAYLALVSGTFNGSGTISSSEWTVPAIGTQLLANPTFAGASAGSPGTPPTSWINLQTTGDLAVSGSVLTFTTSTTRRAIYQTVSVSTGVYAATVQATNLSGTLRFVDVFFIATAPSGTTYTYWIDDEPATSTTTFTGTVSLKIVATITTPGTMQVRIGSGIQGNLTGSVSITTPVCGTSTEPTPVISADVSAVATDATHRFLSRSVDGFEAFYPVLDFESEAGSSLLRCLIDCGEIDIDGSPKHTLIWTTYKQTPDSHVYYNHPDDNDEWTLLFNVAEVGGLRPIRHWHGGTFIPDLGPNEGTLVLFAGDNNEESSILACEDVGDLLANPNTWFARWGLHLSDQDRVDHLAEQPSNYVWIYGSQSARTVDLIVDANNEYAYYLPDTGYTNGFGSVRVLHRVNLATRVVDTPDLDNQYRAEGWYGVLSRGVVILTDLSRYTSDAPVAGSDEYVRAYAVDNHRLVPIKRWLNVTAPATSTAKVTDIVDFNGWVFGRGTGLTGPAGMSKPFGVVGSGLLATDQLGSSVLSRQAMPVAINCFPNPTFADGFTGVETRVTAAVVTDVVDTEYSGVRSLRLTPTSDSGSAVVGFTMDALILEYLRGKWITLSCRYLAPTALAGTQLQYIGFGQMYSGASTQVVSIPKADVWQTASQTVFVPPKATALPIWLYATNTGTDQDPVWFSDICLAEGRGTAYRNKAFVNFFGIE